MQSDYGYELTDRAEKDIDEIAGYIRDELSNASAAMNFLNDVEQCIRRLCDFPSSGSRIFVEYLPGKNVRRKVIGNYLLYYRVLQEKKKGSHTSGRLWITQSDIGSPRIEQLTPEISKNFEIMSEKPLQSGLFSAIIF